MNEKLPQGIYEALIDEELNGILLNYPEVRAVLGKLETEEEPSRYAAFLMRVIEKALKLEKEPSRRLDICNQIVGLISGADKCSHLKDHSLIPAEKSILLEITPSHYASSGIARPRTSLVESSLFTGSPHEPQLVHELNEEMLSADGVDILISFIKWSGLRLLMPGFEDLKSRNVPVRVITTSYLGASDSTAIEKLAQYPNVKVKVSYETGRTRLHAKAYHFNRLSGYSAAYIGSSNMSHEAITSGREWNLKVTTQDMPHIMDKFNAEFETYWNCNEFITFDPEQPERLREAIRHARTSGVSRPVTFFDIRPYYYQERILDALESERSVHGHYKNLVIAATGTGKTVIAAFDFKQFYKKNRGQARLLFIAHRQEILEQALDTFRNVLRNPDFGELLVGPHTATRMDNLFCSVTMLSSRHLWTNVNEDFYDYIIIDEAHHGPASSYRPVFSKFQPTILLGLTATPERMDGNSVAADFGNRFAAEIRLPEALDEKMLCPFHYFGVTDPVGLDADKFWKSGKYDIRELEKVYTGAHTLASQRLNIIYDALLRYEPDLSRVKGIGYCVSVKHAEYMASMFNDRNIPSACLVGDTGSAERTRILTEFRKGKLTFVFTRDVLNEGLDIPEINTVLFLRPTDSLTVFLQQLGRGLRLYPGKDCLTVLDFVGQSHRRCRIDLKLKALLPRYRFSMDREVELNFPHLPSGCSIQLERVAREHVLSNIRENLQNLSIQVPERIQTFESETKEALTFNNFVRYHDYEPETLLVKDTWSAWKAKARLISPVNDPDIKHLKSALVRAAYVSGPREIKRMKRILHQLRNNNIEAALEEAGDYAVSAYYRLWGKSAKHFELASLKDSFQRLSENPSIISDLEEVLEWADTESRIKGVMPELPFPCALELHAQYGSNDIKALMGKATLKSSGETGTGVFHFPHNKAYVFLVTFQKTEKEFSPTTMYADYPISRSLIHWESQSGTTQQSPTGQNLINHLNRGYTIILFARDIKKRNGITVPFSYLGPAKIVEYESERPIKIIWQLDYPMPADMFEENRRGG